MAGGPDAHVDGFVKVCTDKLDVVVCFGGLFFQLVDGIEEDRCWGGGAELKDLFCVLCTGFSIRVSVAYPQELTWHFLEELADIVSDQSNTINISQEMDPSIIIVPANPISPAQRIYSGPSLLQSGTIRSDHMDLIFPSKYYRVVATPLHILRHSLRLGVVLTELLLEVAADNPNLTVFGVKSYEPAVGGDADVFEGSILQDSIFGIGGIHDIYRLVHGQQDFDRSGQRISRRYQAPGMDGTFRRYGK